MELNELRRLTLPKLRDLAKAETDLKGVIGMEKEELIEAIAKAKGLSYEEVSKDVSTIRAIKHDIQTLIKQKAELLSSSAGRVKVRQVQRKVRKLKRLTRKLAHEAKAVMTAKAAAAPAETPNPAAAAKPEQAPQAKEAAPSKEAEQPAEAVQPKETAQPNEAAPTVEAPAAAPAEDK